MSWILVFRVFCCTASVPWWSDHSVQRRFKFYTIDIHVPVRTKTVTLRPAAAWYSEEINSLKKHRRRLERRWRRFKLPADRQLFIDQCRTFNDLLCSSKKSYYTSLINDNQSDYKLLFKTIESVLHRKCDAPYPPSNSPSELANKFVEFYSDKITKYGSTLMLQLLSSQLRKSNGSVLIRLMSLIW